MLDYLRAKWDVYLKDEFGVTMCDDVGEINQYLWENPNKQLDVYLAYLIVISERMFVTSREDFLRITSIFSCGAEITIGNFMKDYRLKSIYHFALNLKPQMRMSS